MASSSSHNQSAIPVQPPPAIPEFGSLSDDFWNDEPATVRIPAAEHLRLATIAHQYGNLCRSLISGGVSWNTIEILSNSPDNQRPESGLSSGNETTAQAPVSADLTVRGQGLDPTRPSYTSSNQRIGVSQHKPGTEQFKPPVVQPDSGTDVDSEAEENSSDTSRHSKGKGPARPTLQRVANRTLELTNLPEGVTHADITAVVRGGIVLDVFLRRNDGAARVSFVHAEDAEAYYKYVCKHDIYIRDRRINFAWCERQFVLLRHVSRKFLSGATRNIVIRNCDPKLTEESIRDDLEHIHNLVVIRVSFIARSCYIATNSICRAAFARSCMISRLKYKGCRIGWDEDECAQSLDRIPLRKFHAAPVALPAAPRRPVASSTNRFQVLDMDEVPP